MGSSEKACGRQVGREMTDRSIQINLNSKISAIDEDNYWNSFDSYSS